MTVQDELLGASGRLYEFSDLKLATTWLAERADFERVRLRSRLAFYRTVRDTLADETRVARKGDLVVTVRPEEHFSKKSEHRYEQVLDIRRKVEAEFGLVTFEPEVSAQGVRQGAD